MEDCRILTEQIIQILDHPELAPSREYLVDLAARYATACTKNNSQLQDCDAWISAGEYSEAVRRANIFQTLENYNILNFATLPIWQELCSNNGFARPPMLLFRQAMILSQAYDTISLMQSFLERHRLLALEQAPVNERLQVLYQLYQMEPQSLLWGPMISELEIRRFQELKNDLRLTTVNGAPKNSFEAIYKEVMTTPWHNRVPADLLAEVNKRQRAIKNSRTNRELTELVSKIEQAYNEMDVNAMRRRILRWQEYLSRHRIPTANIPTSLQDTLRAPFSWYEEQEKQAGLKKEYNKRQSHLETTLNGQDVNEIVAAWSALCIAAESAQIVIPESIAYSCKTRMRLLELNRQRRTRVITIGILCLCFLIGTGIVLGVNAALSSSRHRSDAANIATQLDAFEGKNASQKPDFNALAKAGKYIDELRSTSSSALNSPLVRQQVSRYESLFSIEKQRQNDFTQLLNTVSGQLKNKETNATALDRLSVMAKTDNELIAYMKVKKEHDQLEKVRQSERDNTYLKILDGLMAKNDKLQRIPERDTEKIAVLLDEMQEDFARLEHISDGVNPSYIDRKDKLKTRIDLLYKKTMKDSSINRDYEKLSEFINDPPRFLDRLKIIAKTYPNEQGGQNAKTVANEYESQYSITIWNAFIEKEVPDLKNWDNTPDRGKQLLESFEKEKAKLEGIPEYSALSRYIEKITPVINENGRLGVVQKLVALFNTYSHNDKPYFCLYLTDSDRYYYLANQPSFMELQQGNPIKYIASSNLVTKTSGIPYSSEHKDFIKPAVPSEISHKSLELLNPLLGKPDSDKWLEAVSIILEEIDPLKKRPNLDPLVQTIFLTEILKIICKDPLFASEFLSWLTILTESDEFIPSTNWYEAASVIVRDQRKVCSTILSRLPSPTLTERLAKIKATMNENATQFNVTYQWVGFIDQEGSHFVCRLSKMEEWPDGSLWIGRPSSVKNTTEMTQIGTLQNGEAVGIKDIPRIIRGQPVYLAIKK